MRLPPTSPPSYIMEISFEKSCIRRRCICLLHFPKGRRFHPFSAATKKHHPFTNRRGSYIDNTTRNPNRKSVTVQFYGPPSSTTLVPYHHRRSLIAKNTTHLLLIESPRNEKPRSKICTFVDTNIVHRRRDRVPKKLGKTASKRPS
jgi:hypothetical protein